MSDPNPKLLKPPPGGGEYLTTEELARLLDTTVGAIWNERRRGLAPASLGVKWRNRLWWRRSDIQTYLDESLSSQFEARWKHRHDPAIYATYERGKPEPVVTEARRLHEKRNADA